MRNRGMLGQYAGFITRAVALVLDILIVMTIMFVIYWSVRLPMAFFLNITPTSCVGASLQDSRGLFSREFLCKTVDYIWAITAAFTAPIYFILFYSSTGQTIGMYVMGARVVRMDGKHMSLLGSLIRWLGMFVAMVPLGLGFIWVLFDDRRQGWHDKLAHTCVVYAWRAGQDDFMVARIQRWLRGEGFRQVKSQGKSGQKQTALVTKGNVKLDLITIAFPDYERLDDVLEMIQQGIDASQFHIVNATVLVKGADGSIAVLAASDLSVGAKINRVADEPLALPDYELRRIMADIPPDNFVVAVVIDEQLGDELVRVVSRETAALVRRFDLDAPSSPIRSPQMASIALAK